MLRCSKSGILLYMNPQIEADPVQVRPSETNTFSEEHNFEAIFQIPSSHSLVLIRSRSQGGSVLTEYWEHDEYDSSGELVARYKSFEQSGAKGEKHSGWCKFDKDRQLISESGTLVGDPAWNRMPAL